MALNFYADAGLTLPISAASPKRFLLPAKGGLKLSQLWLGDPYVSFCTVQANSGASVITLSDTGEFLTTSQIAATSTGTATATSGTNTFTYTGKTQSTLTGVSGITTNILVGDKVLPKVFYKGVGGANISMFPAGTDVQNFGLRVAVGSTSILGFPGLPAIFTEIQIQNGVANAIEMFLSIQVPAGVDKEFTNISVQCNNLYKRDAADTTVFSTTEGTYGPQATLYAYRHDQGLSTPIRILPANRQVQANTPGFIVGKYRWRGADNRNATALVPTHWDIDPNVVGFEKFIAGIGDQNDLEPIQLQEVQDSIFMQLQRGTYFTGANGYYLPADWNLEFLQSSLAAANQDGSVTLTLQKTPRPLAPIFVGTYILDNQGYYEKSLEYKYVGTLLNPNGTARTDLPSHYYTLDRRTKKVTLNTSMGHPLVFLGLLSGQSVDYFDIPVYPVDNIDTIYVARGSSALPLFATTWTFNREQGTVQVPAIPGALANEPIFAFCSPAVAVLYDSGPDEVRTISTVDFNPAFSGLASGYFYLQHRRQKPTSLVLSCDKPRIDIPATQASIIGLVAYGPVFFENDYALLKVTAFGAANGETIPNAKLDVVVDPQTFSGTLNYQDPLSSPVSVITGGDGTANLIFIPKGGFGVWIPIAAASGSLAGVTTTNIANDSLVLPDGVPIGQIWNVQEGWLVTTYNVKNDDPLFGKVGGDPTLGEIVWATTGTPGTDTYRTNGERNAWTIGDTSYGNLILPIDAFDAAGHSYTSSSFSGTVKKLVYATALEAHANIGSYFVTFVQRVLIKMQLDGANLFSNSILLEMQVPGLIVENPWLILNDQVQGLLDQFRLGYTQPKSGV